MTSRSDLGLPRIKARCASDIQKANNLTEFIRVTLSCGNGEVFATPTGNQSSGVLSSLSRAHGLLIGPAKERVLKTGSQAAVLLLDAGAAADAEAYFEERRRIAN